MVGSARGVVESVHRAVESARGAAASLALPLTALQYLMLLAKFLLAARPLTPDRRLRAVRVFGRLPAFLGVLASRRVRYLAARSSRRSSAHD